MTYFSKCLIYDGFCLSKKKNVSKLLKFHNTSSLSTCLLLPAWLLKFNKFSSLLVYQNLLDYWNFIKIPSCLFIRICSFIRNTSVAGYQRKPLLGQTFLPEKPETLGSYSTPLATLRYRYAVPGLFPLTCPATTFFWRTRPLHCSVLLTVVVNWDFMIQCFAKKIQVLLWFALIESFFDNVWHTLKFLQQPSMSGS